MSAERTPRPAARVAAPLLAVWLAAAGPLAARQQTGTVQSAEAATAVGQPAPATPPPASPEAGAAARQLTALPDR